MIAEGLNKIAADPSGGFHWPYYIYVPRAVTGTRLLVLPNNTGRLASFSDVERRSRPDRFYSDQLSMPTLTPLFPRPEDMDEDGAGTCQYLGIGASTTRVVRYRRQDLQLLAMIDDALKRLSTAGIRLKTQVLMVGSSASALFTSRFLTLHPDRVYAAAYGALGWPTAPVKTWASQLLSYPYGIADIEYLFNIRFDRDRYRAVKQLFLVGAKDDNTFALPWRTYSADRGKEIASWLEDETQFHPVRMMELAKVIQSSIGADVVYRVYPEKGHRWDGHIQADIVEFFRKTEE